MKIHARHQQILALVRGESVVSVGDIVHRVGASPATIRRDLVALEEAGKLIRTHGGVMDRRSLTGEASFSAKRGRIPAAKRRIGQATADCIPQGATVFIDSGTTCLEAGIALMDRGGNSIYTNSLPLLFNAEKTGAPLVAIGGQLRAISGAMIGALALDWLGHLRFDYSVIGATALDAVEGAMTTELTEAGVKRAAMARSNVSILVADCEKLSQSASIKFAGWSDFQVWVTDSKLPGPLTRKLKSIDPFSLHIAPSNL